MNSVSGNLDDNDASNAAHGARVSVRSRRFRDHEPIALPIRSMNFRNAGDAVASFGGARSCLQHGPKDCPQRLNWLNASLVCSTVLASVYVTLVVGCGNLAAAERTGAPPDASDASVDADQSVNAEQQVRSDSGVSPAASEVELAVGFDFTCARLAGGAVKCWGRNSDGSIGSGDTDARGDQPGEMGAALPTVDVSTGRRTLQLTAGDAHACALLDNGRVKCWGRNLYGQLGVEGPERRGAKPNEMGDALPFVDLGTGRTVKSLDAGTYHTCAILDDDTLKCWGANGDGQLGLEDTEHRGKLSSEMGNALPTVNLGTGRHATAVSAGEHHTCALLDNATVKCWGDNQFGQLGRPSTLAIGEPNVMGDALQAVDLGQGRSAKSIAVGGNHSCALLDDATVKCWGANTFGALGQGSKVPRLGDKPGDLGDGLPPVNVGTNRKVVRLFAGSGRTCVKLDDESVKCWGGNPYGSLGLGNDSLGLGYDQDEMGDALKAISFGANRRAITLGIGFRHTCVVLENDGIKCWGHNVSGELGLGDTEARDTLEEMGDALPEVELTGS